MTPLLIRLRRGPYTKLPNVEIKCDGEVVYTTDTNQLYVAKEGIWVRYAGGDIEVILTAPNRWMIPSKILRSIHESTLPIRNTSLMMTRW